MEFNTHSFFRDFNASKFVVYSCLLIFALVLALREDGVISCSYWLVFLPLWIWKCIAFSGGITGCTVYFSDARRSVDDNSELEFRNMAFGFAQLICLFAFEVMVCYKLDSHTSIPWLFVFIPLFVDCALAVAVCIWAVKCEKNFEFELFFSVNILQFAFVALKLDGLIRWNWVVIFVPLWILICVSLIGVLYAVVLAILFIRSLDLLPEHRRQHVFTAIGYTFLVVPILIFLVLITNKLDGESELPYVMVCSPLYVSLLCLTLMACGTRGGNQWWFGIQKDFCHHLLDSCPLLRLYGNNSYVFAAPQQPTATAESADTADAHSANITRAVYGDDKQVVQDFRFVQRPIQSVTSIELPD